MAEFGTCLGLVAPYYNLVLVLIILPLFIRLLHIKSKVVNPKPWRLLFASLLVYIIEEILTILNSMNVVSSPRILTPFFEMVIITLFIYMLLSQREIVAKK